MTTLRPDTLVQQRYRVLRQIGQGGMGRIYEALDMRLNRRVALKQMLVVGEPLERAFKREAQLLANLDHPALPDVSDHFVDETGQFLVMQYIPGPDLWEMLQTRDEPFPVEQVLDWADQLLQALHYLHTHTPPIIHRDIKPQNLKLKKTGEIILLDFGVAKGSASEGTRVSVVDRSIMAYSLGFTPPEQLEGSGTDARSDLYAVAATLHCLLTKAEPAGAMTRYRARHRPDPLRPVHELNPFVPLAVSGVLGQALELDIDDRPASAAEMRAALQQARHAPAVAPAVSTATVVEGHAVDRASTVPLPVISAPSTPVVEAVDAKRTVQRRRRKPLWLLLAGIPLVAVVGVGLMQVIGRERDDPPASKTLGLVEEAETSVLVSVQASETAVVGTTTLNVAASASSTATVEPPTATPRPTATSTDLPTETPLLPTDVPPTAAPPTRIPPTALPPTRIPPTRVPPTAVPATRVPPTVIPATRVPPTAAPPTAVPPTRVPPTAVPPTAVPPTAVPPPTAYCTHSPSYGGVFVGGCDGPVQGSAGSTCVQGRVLASDGSPFQNAFLVVDRRGITLKVTNYNPSNGVYSQCGLEAGEWGVAVADFTRQGASEITYNTPSEQGLHQIRFLSSGVAGEVFFVNFRER